MTRKARIWVGVTLLAVILFNYLVIGLPLYKRIHYLDNKVRLMKSPQDNYIIDLLKKEAIAVDKKMVILNCVAASAAIIIASWIIYGLIIYREKRKP